MGEYSDVKTIESASPPDSINFGVFNGVYASVYECLGDVYGFRKSKRGLEKVLELYAKAKILSEKCAELFPSSNGTSNTNSSKNGGPLDSNVLLARTSFSPINRQLFFSVFKTGMANLMLNQSTKAAQSFELGRQLLDRLLNVAPPVHGEFSMYESSSMVVTMGAETSDEDCENILSTLIENFEATSGTKLYLKYQLLSQLLLFLKKRDKCSNSESALTKGNDPNLINGLAFYLHRCLNLINSNRRQSREIYEQLSTPKDRVKPIVNDLQLWLRSNEGTNETVPLQPLLFNVSLSSPLKVGNNTNNSALNSSGGRNQIPESTYNNSNGAGSTFDEHSTTPQFAPKKPGSNSASFGLSYEETSGNVVGEYVSQLFNSGFKSWKHLLNDPWATLEHCRHDRLHEVVSANIPAETTLVCSSLQKPIPENLESPGGAMWLIELPAARKSSRVLVISRPAQQGPNGVGNAKQQTSPPVRKTSSFIANNKSLPSSQRPSESDILSSNNNHIRSDSTTRNTVDNSNDNSHDKDHTDNNDDALEQEEKNPVPLPVEGGKQQQEQADDPLASKDERPTSPPSSQKEEHLPKNKSIPVDTTAISTVKGRPPSGASKKVTTFATTTPPSSVHFSKEFPYPIRKYIHRKINLILANVPLDTVTATSTNTSSSTRKSTTAPPSKQNKKNALNDKKPSAMFLNFEKDGKAYQQVYEVCNELAKRLHNNSKRATQNQPSSTSLSQVIDEMAQKVTLTILQSLRILFADKTTITNHATVCSDKEGGDSNDYDSENNNESIGITVPTSSLQSDKKPNNSGNESNSSKELVDWLYLALGP